MLDQALHLGLAMKVAGEGSPATARLHFAWRWTLRAPRISNSTQRPLKLVHVFADPASRPRNRTAAGTGMEEEGNEGTRPS